MDMKLWGTHRGRWRKWKAVRLAINRRGKAVMSTRIQREARLIKIAVFSFSIVPNSSSQLGTSEPTSILIQSAGTSIYRTRRWRDWLPWKAKIWQLSLDQFKVHIKGMDIICYLCRQMAPNRWVQIWLVNCNWNRSTARLRTRLGTKSVSSSCVCLRRPVWPRAVSWTRTSVSIWSRARTSPRTSACSSKTRRCEPTTPRQHTTIFRATSDKPSRWEKRVREIMVKFRINRAAPHF